MNAIKPDLGREALEEAEVLVLKIGGENAVRFKENAARAAEKSGEGKQQILVFSALRSSTFNTTTKLIKAAEALQNGKPEEALPYFEEIRRFHRETIAREVEPEFCEELTMTCDKKIDGLIEKIQSKEAFELKQEGEDWVLKSPSAEFSLTGFGEEIAETLYKKYFDLKQIRAETLENTGPAPRELHALRRRFNKQLKEVLKQPAVTVITGGHKPVLARRRGYSDLSAAELARSADGLGKKVVLGIEKTTPILSGDPRKLKNPSTAQLISELSRNRGGELFGIKGGQAGAIHPDVIETLEGSKVKVVVYNPDNVSQGSTLIGPDTEDLPNRPIVASKDIPSTLIIKGPMSRASGVLYEITKALRHTVIDQTFSSENTWVLTLNDEITEADREKLERKLQKKFGTNFTVAHQNDYSLVLTLGGEGINGQTQILHEEGVNIAYTNGIQENSFAAFVVPRNEVGQAINALHTAFYGSPELEVSKPFFLTEEQVHQVRAEFGSPAYVYSEAVLEKRANEVLNFPAPYGLTARYAMKANPHPEILDQLHGQGIHIDASSCYEAWQALEQGIPGDHILLTSQELPSEDQLRILIEAGVQFNACSLHQLEEYGRLFPGTEVSLRINPGEGSGHHKKTTVAGRDSSFGIWHEQLPEAKELLEKNNLRVKRVHTHIGSGTDPETWARVAEHSLGFMDEFSEATIFNLGGGFKVARVPGEKTADLQEIGAHVTQALEAFYTRTGRKIHLEIEPGTYLVAQAGTIVSTINDIRDTGPDGYKFLVLDTGMDGIVRPSYYGAQHSMVVVPDPSRASTVDDSEESYAVVGHCCESGDLLTPRPGDGDQIMPRRFTHAEIGDAFLIEGAGAYCASMAMRGTSEKGYNGFPIAPEVMVKKDGSLMRI